MNSPVVNACDHLAPSKARILRIEINNPGLPGNLTDIITSRKEGESSSDYLFRRRVFGEEHDKAVRIFLGVPKDQHGTFLKYIQKYYELKKKYVRNVLGYGNFILAEDIESFVSDAGAFNRELRELRQSVRLFLNDRFKILWSDILRFNPRLKYATFILSEHLVRDEKFRYAVSHMREPFRGNPSVEDLLDPSAALSAADSAAV